MQPPKEKRFKEGSSRKPGQIMAKAEGMTEGRKD